LATAEPGIDPAFPPFLNHAYNLKAVAEYETGPDSDIPPERAGAALETAGRFLACVAGILGGDA
jgi:hypothetical protein